MQAVTIGGGAHESTLIENVTIRNSAGVALGIGGFPYDPSETQDGKASVLPMAMMAATMLRDDSMYAGAEPEWAALWKWHAIEEIEHKGVAYDTWLHATRDWSRWRRWKVKSLIMLIVTKRFIGNRVKDMKDLLAQDGLTGWKVTARIWAYLLVRPGFLRRIALPWMAFFLPGFHPWNEDDRHLISKHEGEFADALLPS